MLDKSEYTIRPYTSNDNAALALMWNESDDQWPGTFNEGVPMTEERVRDWMDKESSLVRLVVEDKSDGCIVGFGSLWEDSGDKDTCYVHLLNVHPAHQKRSLARRGVQLAANLAREGFEGLRAEIAYLSLGGSNALKIVYRLINETGAYRRARLGLLAFMQVDGEHKNSVLHADGLQRKRTPHMAWSQVGSWGAVVNPATGRAMVAVGASGEKRVKLSDWGVDGGHIFYYNRVVLEPHGSHEMIAYLALVESLEEARRYRCLAANK